MKKKNIKRGMSFYNGYLLCRDIITWSTKKYNLSTNNDIRNSLLVFFPTEQVYGSRNISDSVVVSQFNFDIKNKKIPKHKKDLYSQPSQVYDRDLKYRKVPKKYYEFSYENSLIFDFDGEPVKNYIDKK